MNDILNTVGAIVCFLILFGYLFMIWSVMIGAYKEGMEALKEIENIKEKYKDVL